MKQSDINHLRRLLGWAACEAGQSPDQMVRTANSIAPAIGAIDGAAKQRMVEAHDKSAAVPKYVRRAIDALQKYVGDQGEIVDAGFSVIPEATRQLERTHSDDYDCHRCLKEKTGTWPFMSRMIFCPTCGNKRCPKANDHRNACTRSNEPGQPGSAYP